MRNYLLFITGCVTVIALAIAYDRILHSIRALHERHVDRQERRRLLEQLIHDTRYRSGAWPRV